MSILSVRAARMASGCVWVRDEFFSSSLDGSFDPIKGVVSGIFSGIDGFLVNFLGYSWFFIF
jgi:hypothetical protein